MKKGALLIICACILLPAAVRPAHAQAAAELKAFQDAAGERSVLFRGKQAARYVFPANGHPYWVYPDFERGDITFEGNFYHDVPINVDAVAQRALVQLEGRPVAVALVPALTPSFTMGSRRFAGLGAGGPLPEGFYEILGSSAHQVYKHVSKYVVNSPVNANGDGIGYYDEYYRADLPRHFAYRAAYYYLNADGSFSRIRNRRALLRKFPDRKREIRRALQARGLLDPDSDFDEFCETVLELAGS